jgi:hypothetical protein
MRTRRYFYISNDLDDLEAFEEELEAAGIDTVQIHVLSEDPEGLRAHQHLHEVQEFMKKDVVHSGLFGAVVGLIAATLALVVPYSLGWTETPAGWVPFAFLAVILLGFCTWEGGLLGMHRTNHHFETFRKELEAGRHVFFVDAEPGQEKTLETMLERHPRIQPAGRGHAMPHWLISVQRAARSVLRVWP